uniref:Uncharacterized protein n=1 Tax=Cannabis sativa TaxID=3483 RepID=A0A803QSE4_CANSA
NNRPLTHPPSSGSSRHFPQHRTRSSRRDGGDMKGHLGEKRRVVEPSKNVAMRKAKVPWAPGSPPSDQKVICSDFGLDRGGYRVNRILYILPNNCATNRGCRA